MSARLAGPHPLRLLLVGYGLSAVTGSAIAMTIGGVLAPILVFWLGGAVMSLCAPLIPGVGAWFRRPVNGAATSAATSDDEAAMAEALRRWEADGAADRASPIDARRLG